jgi:hypothetical protein
VKPIVGAALLALLLPGCLGGARGGRWRALPEISEDEIARATPPPVFDDQVPGTPPFRVTWEALAREVRQMENPRFPVPQGFRATRPETKIVLMNASHPEAVKQRLRAWEGRSQRFEAEIAIVGDAEMVELLTAFEKMRVFEYARPTDALTSQFGSDRARGRITVDRGGESVTLLSLYGLGLQESTRPIQGIYSDAKRAIAVLKNRTATLSVTGFRTDTPRKR